MINYVIIANYTHGPRIVSVKHVIKGKQQLVISGSPIAEETSTRI